MSSPVLFVFGGTGNVGSALAKRFAKQGYKVALASRSAETGFRAEDGSLLVKLDVAQPSTISGAFETVKEHFGRTPSVVVYNGASTQLLFIDKANVKMHSLRQ